MGRMYMLPISGTRRHKHVPPGDLGFTGALAGQFPVLCDALRANAEA